MKKPNLLRIRLGAAFLLSALAVLAGGCATETHYGHKSYKSVEWFEKVDHSFGVALEQEPKDNTPVEPLKTSHGVKAQ